MFSSVVSMLNITLVFIPKLGMLAAITPEQLVLGVEPDYLVYSKVSAGCIPQEDCTPLHARVVGGGAGPVVPRRGFGGSAPKAKNRCKIAL